MSTIVTRAGKGAPLSNTEMDANFTNLNSDKYQSGDSPSFTNLSYTGTLTGGTGVINIGSGQIYKDASGNVGIGTNSPSSFSSLARNLVVNGSTNAGITISESTGGGAASLLFAATSAFPNKANITNDFTSGSLQFGLNATERMRIDSSGNLLVGTTTATTAGGSYTAITTNGANGSNLALNGGGTNIGLIYAATGNSNLYIGNQTASGNVIFNAGSGSERMRIDSSGNVGIGNTVASTIAAVNGGGTLVVGAGGAANQGVTIYTASTQSGILNFADGTTTTSTYAGYIAYNHVGDRMEFGTGAAERMRIDSSGNVGIGTSSPNTALQLGGASNKTIRIDSATGNAAFFGNFNTYTIMASNRNPNTGVFVDTGKASGSILIDANNGVSNITFNTTTSNNTDPTERMRIDSSGNVGIGTSSPTAKLEVNGNSIFSGQINAFNYTSAVPSITNTALYFVGNAINSANYAGQYYSGGSSHDIYMGMLPNSVSGSSDSWGVGRIISGAYYNSLMVNSAGEVVVPSSNLLVGVTSSNGKLTVTANASQPYGTFDAPTNGYAFLRLNYNGSQVGSIGQGSAVVTGGGSTDLGLQANNNLIFATNTTTERMRIDSSGNLLVGTTSTGYLNADTFSLEKSNGYQVVNHSSSRTSGAGYILFGYNGGGIGSISQNGTTGVTYGTTSDYRLKENVVPMMGALDKVAQLKPVTYTWKTDGSDGQGFIAHELQEVVPDCVTGEKDAVDEEGNPVYQGIDTSFLVATLTAAIQELKAEFDAYKATHP